MESQLELAPDLELDLELNLELSLHWNYFTSNDPRHEISIICFHAMVGSILPWSVALWFSMLLVGRQGLQLAFYARCDPATTCLPTWHTHR